MTAAENAVMAEWFLSGSPELTKEEIEENYFRPMAEAWWAGKAPKFMYEPPFFQGFKFVNRETGEVRDTMPAGLR